MPTDTAASTVRVADAPKNPRYDSSKVAGNAPPEIKEFIANAKEYNWTYDHPRYRDQPYFGKGIQNKFQVTEVSVLNKADEEKKLEGRVVVELIVGEDMINGSGNIHGGCSAFLVDMCSSMAISTLKLATTGKDDLIVSQAINMIYHSPAAVGDKLRIVNTSVTVGNRAQSARTEIWNATHNRLVASGTHVTMCPSPPPDRKRQSKM
ncbi:hypothetical protein FA15DRAFT_673061 [Coprinopsis marcescibilis]|uniref:Thioesterase domain-containing protein n=1 Tax=Coprinopsis marcescibilis TaxID=230819 RepID=A0A5C3KKY3_COPMA|nr:hypothetical protein FA15DRAFT_673061 [Coprinopsis marcescibilis]